MSLIMIADATSWVVMVTAPPGPAVEITSPELKKSPVPMVPPTPTITADEVLIVRLRPILWFMTFSMQLGFFHDFTSCKDEINFILIIKSVRLKNV